MLGRRGLRNSGSPRVVGSKDFLNVYKTWLVPTQTGWRNGIRITNLKVRMTVVNGFLMAKGRNKKLLNRSGYSSMSHGRWEPRSYIDRRVQSCMAVSGKHPRLPSEAIKHKWRIPPRYSTFVGLGLCCLQVPLDNFYFLLFLSLSTMFTPSFSPPHSCPSYFSPISISSHAFAYWLRFTSPYRPPPLRPP